MRLYGGRLIQKKIRQQVAEKQEQRDAIVYAVVPVSRYCMVKIQGSDTQVKAYYPENWESTPQFLKPGNAVRISHPGGNKARIEIVGHGFLIPTAVPGGSVTPPAPTPGDAVLTGANLTAADPANLTVTVGTGTVRIGGVTYSLGGITMDRTDIEMDRFDLDMGGASDVVSFDAASATLFRYDLIVVGADGDSHAVKGAESASAPVMPTVPADHVALGWVLFYPGMTAISQSDINRTWTTPVPSELRLTVADQDLLISELSTTITAAVLDQYGQGYSGTWYITATFLRGNGTLAYGGSSSGTALVFNFTGYAAAITYTRDGNDPGDQSPTFTVEEAAARLSSTTHINVYNTLGNLML